MHLAGWTELKVVRALVPFLRQHPWTALAVVALGLLSSLAEGLGISLFIPFLQSLDKMAPAPEIGNWLSNSLGQTFSHISPDHRLFIVSLCIFCSILVKASLSYANTVLSGWLYARISHQFRLGIFEQLLTVSYQFLERIPSGNLLNTLSTESWRASDALSGIIHLLTIASLLAVYIALLLLISWQLTLLVIVAMSVIALLVRILTRSAKGLGRKHTQANAILANRMLEGVEGMKVIRAFGQEGYERKRFDRTSQRLGRILLRLGMISGLVNPVYEILAAALLIAILLTTLQTPENLPALLVFIFVLYRLQPKIIALDRARVGLASLATAVEEVTSLIDRSNKPYPWVGKVPFHRLERGISLHQVSFRYTPDDKLALDHVSLHIPAGKTTALVGPSGAGKSTLIKLILRLYEVTEGEIYADDHRLQTLEVGSWRSRIAMVSQDIYVFNTTVRENIAYGRCGATDDEVIEAAKLAHAHEFICRLPQGYQTLVGDRGVRLSGGQQQRITLARAIIRNPEILILDEATNALDSLSEQLIQEALDTLSQHRTVLVIAHRLSTIERADHIVVLEDGQIHEQGDFRRLLKSNGLFATLYHLQHRKILA